jgi:hypothetical protein
MVLTYKNQINDSHESLADAKVHELFQFGADLRNNNDFMHLFTTKDDTLIHSMENLNNYYSLFKWQKKHQRLLGEVIHFILCFTDFIVKYPANFFHDKKDSQVIS